jgi:FkbM family methyltransferase
MKYLFLLWYNFLENFFHLIKIKKFLKKNIFFKKPIIFDVGCHKGKITKIFFDLYNHSKIYCFEPNKLLHKTIRQNNLNKNLTVNSYAVGEKVEEKLFSLDDLDLTSSLSKINKNSFYLKIKKMILGISKNSLTKKVKVITIDNFCRIKKITRIDLIKIDVEGYEYMVLLGSKKMIKNTNYIIIEIQKNSMYKDYSKKKIETFLKKNNFYLLKKFNFPLMFFEDRIYKNRKFN